MKIVWEFTPEDIEALRDFVASQRDNAFVRNRIRNNLENPPAAVSVEEFWQRLVGSLLSSQQRSGPYSHVSRFLAKRPFPLAYDFYRGRDDKAAAGTEVMQAAGGIRFTTRNARFLAQNHDYLAGGGWAETRVVHLSAGVLSDPHYYNFVSDGVQALCARSGIYPCVFDAAVFSSYDDGWNDENIVW